MVSRIDDYRSNDMIIEVFKQGDSYRYRSFRPNTNRFTFISAYPYKSKTYALKAARNLAKQFKEEPWVCMHEDRIV